jgi:lipoprotein-releasing system permease protein
MALMVALGLMTGLQQEIRTRILGATAHLSVFRRDSAPFADDHRVLDAVRHVPGVLGAAPAAYGKALLSSAGGTANVATVKGIEPQQERTVTELASQVEGGRLDELRAPAEGLAPVLLGRDLAASLAVDVGDVVTLTSPQGRLSPVGMLPRVTKFKVIGLVHTGLYEFDNGWAYVPLASAARLFGQDGVNLVEVRVEDMYAVRATGDAIRRALGEGFITNDWIAMNQSLFSALWLEKMAIGVTIGLIVMVAALNIVATLILMVMEKHKDIAILVSMGASRAAVMRIFMLQGTVIGAAGTVAGAALGWGVCRLLDHYKLIRVPVDVYQIAYVPFKLLPADAAVVIAGAVLVCFVATIYPALGAASLDPAEALRYE